MKKSSFGVLAVVLLVVAALFCWRALYEPNKPQPAFSSQNSPLVEVGVRLPIPAADSGFAPFYLAVDKGFFEAGGLKVTLQPGSPELNPIKMVAQNVDQFGLLGGPELLLSARNKDAPIVGVALLGKDADLAGIVTLKTSGLTKLAQLQGKKVGFYYGHISTDILHMLFKKENIQVEEVDTGFDYGQLINGKVDAEWAFQTTAGINLPAKGIEINFIQPADYGIHSQGYTVVVNQDYAKQNPGVVRRFVAAVIEATKYSAEHPAEAVAATMKRDPNFKQAVGDAQIALYNKGIRNHDRLGAFSKNDLEATAAQMKSAGLLPPQFDPSPAFDNQYAEAYYAAQK